MRVSRKMGAALAVAGIAVAGSVAAIGLSGPAGAAVGTVSATTVTVTASATQLTYGSEPAETFTATVSSPAGGTPTGTVTVTGPDDTIDGTRITLCTITLAAGTGSCQVAKPTLPGGADTITAKYGGDVSYAAASGSTTVTVARAPSAVTATLSPTTATITGDTIKVTFSFTVTGPGGTPTGWAFIAGQNEGVDGCDAIPVNGGTVRCTGMTSIATGRHGFSVYFEGGNDYLPSESAWMYLTVIKTAKTTTSLTLAKSAVTYGHETAEKLTVSVSRIRGVYPYGKVTVKAGSKTVCIITLRSGHGSCTLSAKALKAGTYHLVASYPGNAIYLASASASKPLKVVA
ncbi:MAG: hypothetical protein JWM19_3137 [Actinomycetia bacterium]|nr:hypothetical protein [Actinomycetes bacterium]